MEFYDVHAHCIKGQKGGFLIGLEGKPSFENTMTNKDVVDTVFNNKDYLGAYYVGNGFGELPDERIIKYHPRREHYSLHDVLSDIKKRKCKLCIVDTLNQPWWQPLDYWKLVAQNPDVLFLLSHMGGYDILEFVKILDFNKNVYADFSMTQEYFGWCGERAKMPVVSEMIDYCVNSAKLRKRVLFGSDEPFFSQAVALEKYMKLDGAEDILVNNYLELLERIV